MSYALAATTGASPGLPGQATAIENAKRKAAWQIEYDLWKQQVSSNAKSCGMAQASVSAANSGAKAGYDAELTEYQKKLAIYEAAVRAQTTNQSVSKQLGTQYGFAPPAQGCITAAQKQSYADQCARATAVLAGLGAYVGRGTSGLPPVCGQKLLPVCTAVPPKPSKPPALKVLPLPECPPDPPKPVLILLPMPTTPVDRPEIPTEEIDTSASSMMVGGLLGILIVGGVVYAATRKKKKAA